jgi:hypothetical protein
VCLFSLRCIAVRVEDLLELRVVGDVAVPYDQLIVIVPAPMSITTGRSDS